MPLSTSAIPCTIQRLDGSALSCGLAAEGADGAVLVAGLTAPGTVLMEHYGRGAQDFLLDLGEAGCWPVRLTDTHFGKGGRVLRFDPLMVGVVTEHRARELSARA